jgi:hypothetical protein
MNTRLILSGLVICAALCVTPETTHAQIFVTNFSGNNISEYDAATGSPINTDFVSGLDSPTGLALSEGHLFVASQGAIQNGTVGEYDAATGATVNASLISGLITPVDVAVSGGNLFVTDGTNGTIGEYTMSGAPVNPSLVSGLNFPFGLAISGGKLFVVNAGAGPLENTVGEYDAATGTPINPTFITSLLFPRDIAVSGGHLFVSQAAGVIGEYDAVTGAPINPSFNLSFDGPRGMAFLGGNLLVADTVNNVVGEIDSSGTTTNFAFISAGLNGPEEIVVAAASVPDACSPWTLLLVSLTAMVAFCRSGMARITH